MDNLKLVSVICITYNHEKFIRDTILGVINQETDFPFELIIHDDASTDGTVEIIKEYAKLYPNIIRTILQPVNLYSQGVSITKTQVLPHAKGKYVAFCEGDDYWIDTSKLQRQADFLEKNEEFSACVHNSMQVNYRTGIKRVLYAQQDKELFFKDVCPAGGHSFHTSSIFCRRLILNKPPFEINGLSFGDYVVALQLVLAGRIYYFHDVMSVYRFQLGASWTSRNSSKESMIRIFNDNLLLLEVVSDKVSANDLAEVEKTILIRKFQLFMEQDNYCGIEREPYKSMYRALPILVRVKHYTRIKSPKLFNYLKGNIDSIRERRLKLIENRKLTTKNDH